jgi:23S rRNA pseudouridine955/2504/2580 synthase
MDSEPGKPWWWHIRWIFKVFRPVRASLCLENNGNICIITKAEAGMKALRFLERRLSLPRPLLFRLLRTGKIRINRSRVKPEHILAPGDEVKVPLPLHVQGKKGADPAVFSPGRAPSLGPGLDIVYMDESLLVLNKAPGLPVQPGSGHMDSVSSRLGKAFAGSPFIPAPAHRLDKQSSGLILAGRVYLAQRHLHRLFSARKAELDRRYLVWVSGVWDLPGKTRFKDGLVQKKGADNLERMYVLESAENGLEAITEYKTLKILRAVGSREDKTGPGIFPPGRAALRSATLLEARLFTGRKHQIRVQCASRGYPVIGDARYAGPQHTPMLLHACKIALPGVNPLDAGSTEKPFCSGHFEARPDWPEPFTITDEIWFSLEHYNCEQL